MIVTIKNNISQDKKLIFIKKLKSFHLGAN